MGGRSPLAYRLEEMPKERFRLGAMHPNKNYAGWFLKTFRMGIAAGAGGAGGAGGSAEGGARNSTSKLYTADTEQADAADKGATVTDNDQLDALRFNSKEANPTFLKFNSAQVFRRFAGKEALRKWKIDGTTIAPEVMSWLFQDREVTKLISHEFNMYLYHRRKVNEKNNLGWLRSFYHSQIQ